MSKDVYFTRGEKAYYNEAAKILKKSSIFRVLAKTPTLFISSQRQKPHQKAYYKELMRAISSGRISVEYVFSLPLTKAEILNISKSNATQALNDLNEWSRFAKHPKVDLKYIPDKNPFSCVIGDKYTAILAVYPNGQRGCLTVSNKMMPFYLESFKQIFKEASKNHKSIIAEIRRAIA